MLNKEEITLLQNCFLFTDSSSEDIAAFLDCPHSSICYFKRGEQIFGKEHKGELGILLSGRATASADKEQRSALRQFAKGDLFGAASVFCETPDFSKIIALTSVNVLYIDQDGVEKLLTSSPERAMAYIKFLAGRVEFLNRKIHTFTSLDSLIRVAGYIKENADREGVLQIDNYSALAKSLGIGRASLYRAKAELIKEKVISADKKSIKVLSFDALYNLI